MEQDVSSINKDLKYHRFGRPVRSVFWILMTAVLIYGLLGGLGDKSGPLNKKITQVGSSEIQYEPFLRVGKSFSISVFVKDSETEALIGFDNTYADKIKITEIIPEPAEVFIRDNHVYYRFTTSAGGKVTFFQDPLKPGRHHVGFSVNGASTVIKQFIFF